MSFIGPKLLTQIDARLCQAFFLVYNPIWWFLHNSSWWLWRIASCKRHSHVCRIIRWNNSLTYIWYFYHAGNNFSTRRKKPFSNCPSPNLDKTLKWNTKSWILGTPNYKNNLMPFRCGKLFFSTIYPLVSHQYLFCTAQQTHVEIA